MICFYKKNNFNYNSKLLYLFNIKIIIIKYIFFLKKVCYYTCITCNDGTKYGCKKCAFERIIGKDNTGLTNCICKYGYYDI